jgi:hypothetical protein
MSPQGGRMDRGQNRAATSPMREIRTSGSAGAPGSDPRGDPARCSPNFGYTAGVAEALLQSHAGEISLLPALPTDWTDGSVTGLRARGGLEVSMQWKAGKLVSAQIRGITPGPCRVRSGGKTVTVPLQAGQALKLNADLVSGDDVRGQR